MVLGKLVSFLFVCVWRRGFRRLCSRVFSTYFFCIVVSRLV